MNSSMSSLKVLRSCPGRAIHILPDGTLYRGRNLDICRSADDGRTWQRVVRMPCSLVRRAVQSSRLACRLLRHEVRALVVLEDGTHVAANRQGIFYAAPGETMMQPCKVESPGVALMPPMCITLGPQGRILWGEYSNTSRRHEVRLCVSDDGGRSFTVAWVFEAGSIQHIHNLVYDTGLSQYWVLAGDHEHEPGIGRLSADLKDFEWLVKGEQQFRAVEVFDFGDHLIYGTDTEKAANAIMRLEKTTGRIERLQETDGSCIYACRFGGLYVLSTSVEPSGINHSRIADIWVSRDGDRWERVLRAEKDFWHPTYFQFGSLVLPRGASEKETIFFSGQALKGLDGQACVAHWQGADSAEPTTESTDPVEDGNQAR